MKILLLVSVLLLAVGCGKDAPYITKCNATTFRAGPSGEVWDVDSVIVEGWCKGVPLQ